RPPKGAWLGLITVVAYTLVIGLVVFGFAHSAVFSLLAGLAVGAGWAVSRWLTANMTWKFAFALRYALNLAVVSAVWLTAEADWVGAWEFLKGLVNSHNLL